MKLWEYTRANPDCEHCGTVTRAMTDWDQTTHDTCICPCHTHKTTKAKASMPKPKKGRKK